LDSSDGGGGENMRGEDLDTGTRSQSARPITLGEDGSDVRTAITERQKEEDSRMKTNLAVKLTD
jgi:hypothetical protein